MKKKKKKTETERQKKQNQNLQKPFKNALLYKWQRNVGS